MLQRQVIGERRQKLQPTVARVLGHDRGATFGPRLLARFKRVLRALLQGHLKRGFQFVRLGDIIRQFDVASNLVPEASHLLLLGRHFETQWKQWRVTQTHYYYQYCDALNTSVLARVRSNSGA